MRLARRLLFPYLKRFFLMLLSVILVGAFGCGILIGLRNAYHSLDTNVNSLILECGYPDLYVKTIDEVDKSVLSYLPKGYEEYMGMEGIEYRPTLNSTFSLDGNPFSAKLIGYDEDSLLKHHTVEGKQGEGATKLDYYFARSNGISVGDTVFAKMGDGENVGFRIDALVVSPETSMVKADPYSISSSRDFAYLYIPKSTLLEHAQMDYFNEILILYKEGQEKDLEATGEAMKACMKEKMGIDLPAKMEEQFKGNIAFATTYDDSEVIIFYSDALKAINLITLLAPGVFFLVVLIVSCLFLFQIVKQCRKDIGVMRALGEKNSSISLVFLSLGFLVGFLSWVLGSGIGAIFTLLANEAYGTALKLFPQPFLMHPAALFVSLMIVVSVTLLTSFLASLNISRIKPVEAMKALPPSKNETPFLTRTLFKKAPIPLKVTISQTLRNLSRYILSGICLLASGMLIFVALSVGESKNTMMAQLFETRLNYDVQVYLDGYLDEALVEGMFPEEDNNILEKTYIKYVPSDIINTVNEKRVTALVNGIKPDQDLLRVIDDYSHTIDIPKNGIVLSSYHAGLLDAKVGDKLTVGEEELTVSSISNEFLFQVNYVNYDDFSPSHSRGSLLAKVKDVDAFFSKYKDLDHVTYVAFTKVIQSEFNDRLAAFEISSRLLNFMAIVIGFMIVFNMMQTNLKEQKRTFATMRTLGYQRSSISSANLFASLFQYLLSMALAVPLGVVLSKGLLKSISVPSQIHPFPHTWVMYVLSLVFVLAFLLLSHILVMGKMRKWNLPESVKERE